MIRPEFKKLSDEQQRDLYRDGISCCLSNSALTLELLPAKDCGDIQLSKFAVSIDGYTDPGAEEDPEPELTELRRRLFFAQRSVHWDLSTLSDYEAEARALVEKIRACLLKREPKRH